MDESYHSHNGESPVGRGSCLENSPGVMPQEFDSLSLRKFWRVDRVVKYRFAKPRISYIRNKGSIPLLSAMAIWQRWSMHPAEDGIKKVQILWAPHLRVCCNG